MAINGLQRWQFAKHQSLVHFAMDALFTNGARNRKSGFAQTLVELRYESLKGIVAKNGRHLRPAHILELNIEELNRPWISEKGEEDLQARAKKTWGTRNPPTREALFESFEGINAQYCVLATEYDRHLDDLAIHFEHVDHDRIIAPAVTAESFLKGAHLLFDSYKESKLWPTEHVIAAVAGWWGIRLDAMEQYAQRASFLGELEQLDENLGVRVRECLGDRVIDDLAKDVRAEVEALQVRVAELEGEVADQTRLAEAARVYAAQQIAKSSGKASASVREAQAALAEAETTVEAVKEFAREQVATASRIAAARIKELKEESTATQERATVLDVALTAAKAEEVAAVERATAAEDAVLEASAHIEDVREIAAMAEQAVIAAQEETVAALDRVVTEEQAVVRVQAEAALLRARMEKLEREAGETRTVSAAELAEAKTAAKAAQEEVVEARAETADLRRRALLAEANLTDAQTEATAAQERAATAEAAFAEVQSELEAARARVAEADASAEQARVENAALKEQLAAAQAGAAQQAGTAKWSGGKLTGEVFTAVQKLLSADQTLWDRRLQGEQTLSFKERLQLLSEHLDGDIGEWRQRFGDLGFMTEFVQDSLGAAAFVGYDFSRMQPADHDVLTPYIVYERVEGRVQSARALVEPGTPIELTWNEVIRSMQPNGPLTQISSYLYYHNTFAELERYHLLERIGEAPSPWVHPWPLVRFKNESVD